MKKLILAACALAGLSLTACENIKGPHVVFRTTPLPPVVVSTLSADGTIVGNTAMMEQQVDVVAVLASVLGQKGHPVEFNKAAGVPVGGINLGGYDADHRLNMLIAYAETTLPSDDLKHVRTSLASQLLYASDTNCSEYLLGLRGGQVTSRLSTDLLAAGFALSGTLAKFPATAKRMSAYAGAANAIGATIDRDIFSQQAAELIADAIVRNRATLEAGLRKHFKESYADWPIGTVLSDVTLYHQECSVMRGLSSMREAVIAREQTVHAIRLAAASVEQNGGDGREVLAVLAGLDSESGKPLETTPFGGSDDDEVSEDLEAAAANARKCGDTIVEAARNNGNTVVTSAQIAKYCDATKGSALDQALIGKYTAALASNQTAFDAIAAQYHTGISDEASNTLQAKLLLAYRKMASDVMAGIDQDIDQLANSRKAFDRALDGPSATVTGPNVTSIASNVLPDSDPLKAALVASLAGVGGATGPDLANLVRHTWQGLRENALKTYQ